MGYFPRDVKSRNGHCPIMDEVIWKKRLRSALEERSMTMKQASLAAGQGETFVRDILERNRAPSIDKFMALSKALGMKPEVLLGEGGGNDGEPREYTYHSLEEVEREADPETLAGYAREHWKPKFPGALPELDISAGAGEGTVGNIIALQLDGGSISAHEVVDEWPLPLTWLHEAVNDVSQSLVVKIVGDSMVPNYLPGDRVIVDLSQDRFMNDSAYLISDGEGAPQIKRLQRIPLSVPTRVAIISDNPAYPNHEVEVDLLRIHGRVCAHVGRR